MKYKFKSKLIDLNRKKDKMSFFIKTNIKVDDSVASDFNDMVITEMKEHEISRLSRLWRFDQDNVLYSDYSDYSNYSYTNNDSISLISCLDYLIKRFFEPRGVKLNGTIMGFGDLMIYVYNVKDNVIHLDTRTTRFLIEKYKEIQNNKEDTHIKDFLKYNFELYHYASKRGCDLFDYFNIFV
jgi:hypothetical protein